MSDDPEGSEERPPLEGARHAEADGDHGDHANDGSYLSEAMADGGGAAVHDIFFSPEGMALGMAAAIYSKAFVETLGQRSGDRFAKILGERFTARRVRRKGKPDEEVIGFKGRETTATIVVTHDLPDEARRALIDLDFSADGIRGRVLRWNADAAA